MIKVVIDLPCDPDGRSVSLTPEQAVMLFDELESLCNSVVLKEAIVACGVSGHGSDKSETGKTFSLWDMTGWMSGKSGVEPIESR